GEVVTLIGANGAGKSTTLRSINGLNTPREGRIVFQGKDITRRPPHEIVQMGISQSPEGRRLFPHMTVLENLEMGAFQRSDRSQIKEDLDRGYVLETGRVALADEAKALRENEQVQKTYLGIEG